VKAQKVTHDFGLMNDCAALRSITTSPDNVYLFVACHLILKQYRINDHELVKKYSFDELITSVVTTFDNKYVFVGMYENLHQICIESQKVIKDYGAVHYHKIHLMVVTRDNKFLITGC